MILGDASDQRASTEEFVPRRDAAFRDDTVQNAAQKIFEEGIVEFERANELDPLVSLRVNTDIFHVKSKDINNPLGGLDSGVTGDLLEFRGEAHEILSIAGNSSVLGSVVTAWASSLAIASNKGNTVVAGGVEGLTTLTSAAEAGYSSIEVVDASLFIVGDTI